MRRTTDMSSRFAGMAPDNVEIGEALGFPLIESNPSDVEETRALTSCCIQSKKVLQHTALSYHTVLEQRPLLVKSISALFILGSADLVGQGIQALRDEGTGSLDVLRTVRFAVFGFVLQAPWNHFYYLALDGALPPTEYPWTKRTFVKVVIDQFLQAPIFTALMFLFLGLLEAKSMEAIGTQLQDDYWHTMIENCE